MERLTDLHMHTTASDGADTVVELLENLKARGVGTFSVTDHDTVAGAVEMERLVPRGMRFIRGVEFSCAAERGNCHILGYGYDPENVLLRQALEDGSILRWEKLQRRLNYLEEKFGIRMTEEEMTWLYSQNNPGKPHLGRILVDRGIAPDISTAIQNYINGCKGGRERIPAGQAIRAILSAGGVPVWAHPLGGEGERRLSREEVEERLEELCSDGIQGLECYYSRYSREDIAFLVSKAESRGLLVSGGSDYHGSNKTGITLGMLNEGDEPVDESRLTILSRI